MGVPFRSKDYVQCRLLIRHTYDALHYERSGKRGGAFQEGHLCVLGCPSDSCEVGDDAGNILSSASRGQVVLGGHDPARREKIHGTSHLTSFDGNLPETLDPLVAKGCDSRYPPQLRG